MDFSFFKRLFSKQREKGYNSAEWTTLSGEPVERQLLDRNKEWVFVSVDKVAKAVSAVRFKVMRFEKSKEDVEVFDHPMVEFLEHPADDFTGKDFIYLDTAYKELLGNAYWEIKPGNVIVPLIPTNVRPIVESGRIVRYEYSDDKGKRDISADKVLHDRYIDPKSPYRGVGKLEKISRWIDTSFYSNEFLRLFFINGAQFGGFIKTEEESEERIKLIKTGLANDHTGVQNAHKIAVLPKGSEFQAVTSKMSDMQFTELDEGYRDKILAAFGVPKTLIGFTTEVNRASAEASEYIFAKYTVKPIVDDFVEFLNHKVAPKFDATGKFYFAYDEFVPENMEIKLKEREISLAKQAYKTVNEVRAELGLPPTEGGDTVYNAMGLPLGDKPPAPMMGPGPGKAIPPRARSLMKRERLIESIVDRAAEAIGDLDIDALNHKAFVGRVEAYEERIEGAVRDFNNQQESGVLARLARITKGVAKQDVFDMDTEVGVLVDFVTPLLKGLMVEQALEEYAAQGFAGSLDTGKDTIARFVELAAKRLSKGYNDTTADLLKKALNEGIAAGDGFDKLAERVRSVYAYSDDVRAAAVAKTESFYVANEASREAYRQSGVVETIRWYTAEDERVCPYCGPMHGKIIKVTETFFKKGETVEGADGTTFTTDYRAIDVPPLHTNCRCFIRPETIKV